MLGSAIKNFAFWSIGAAIVTPIAPVALALVAGSSTGGGGNGAGAWGKMAMGLVCTVALVPFTVLGVVAFFNPVLALQLYIGWCLVAGVIGATKFSRYD